MAVMSGRKAIMDIFQAEGVQYIFGNPGTTELPFIEIIRDYPDIRYILALHEGVALGIAHQYANASGKTGVVNLHVAPGLGNAVGSLYNAAMGNVPLLVTVGQQDGRMVVREPVLAHNLVDMAKPLTKWAIQINKAEEIPVIVPRALKLAQDPPRGPVMVALPTDILEGEADFSLQLGASSYFRRTAPDPQGIAAAAEILKNAEHPIMICGDGVDTSGAEKETANLAELIGAQVYTPMFTGGMNFPMSHPNFRGNLTAAYQTIAPVLEGADVIIAVGAKLISEAFYTPGGPFPNGCPLIQINDSTWEIGKNIPATVGILADPKKALVELMEALEAGMAQEARSKAEARCSEMKAQKKAEQDRHQKRAQAKWDAVPISPARLMVSLKNVLPKETLIFNEGITASVDVTRALEPDEPGSYFSNTGGGIGQGLPGAIGIKLANPEKPVVAIVGDGSAMYTIQSLWTAAHHKVPVIYIIISNQSYRILKYNMNRFRRTLGLVAKGEPHPFMDLNDPPLDFVEIANGMGIDGKKITRPEDIEPAVKAALDANVPYLLEVITEKTVPQQ